MRLIPLLVLALSACSSPQVRCDKHLQPINAPAAKEPSAKQPAAQNAAAQVIGAIVESRP
jgi:hypothetical protein